MGIFRGSTPQILQDLGVAGIEYQVTLTLTPEQIRSLNTLPVDIVVPANANTLLAPGQLVFVGKQGTTPYSSAPNVQIQYAGGLDPASINGENWNGSVGSGSMVADVFANALGTNAIGFVNTTPLLGLALQISSGGDVTGTTRPARSF